MKMNDMVIISVDDHISEPPDMFDKHLSGDALASAPKLRASKDGTHYWEYQGMKMPSVGLNAVEMCIRDRLDTDTFALTYASGGHDTAFVRRRNDVVQLAITGPVLGVMEEPFGAETIYLQPGDTLVLATDGLTEVRNRAGEQLSGCLLYTSRCV